MNKLSSKTSLFLIELVLSIFFFIVATAICMQLFVNTYFFSLQTKEINQALLWRQNLAEPFLGNNGDYCIIKTLFGEMFDVVVGQREGIAVKPAPDSAIEIMRQLGVTAEDTVFIGDTNVDINTAKNAGVPCLCVLWGFRDKEDMTAVGGEHFCQHPKQLVKKIEELIHGK